MSDPSAAPESIRALDSEFDSLRTGSRQQWLNDYVALVEDTRDATPDVFALPDFQRRLWEDSPISGSGMSSVPMNEVINSIELAHWIGDLRSRVLPEAGEARVRELDRIYEELLDRVKPLTTRVPWLKVARVLAAIFPKDVTCVVDKPKLRLLAKAMLGSVPRGTSEIIGMNALVLGALAETLGPTTDDAESVVKRSIIAWDLYSALAKTEEKETHESGEIEGDRPGESSLRFLPNDRRLKGLTAISGYVDTALKLLDFVRNGATVDETKDFIRAEFPKHKDGSIQVMLSVVRHNLGLLRLNGNTLEPSSLGLELLETEDPTLLIPRALTKVLGFDLILFLLREESPRTRRALVDALKEHYHGWTTDYAPSALLQWAVNLGMIESAGDQSFRLTEAGTQWAAQITSRPTPSEVISSPEIELADTVVTPPLKREFVAPGFADIVGYFRALPFVFPEALLARLHSALHAHPSKHFVLLSGLSGTGKTKIAELYAAAYHQVAAGEENRYFCRVPVQPDWTDATGLLGYVNPLHETATFMGTEFLKFLQQAVSLPKVPHFVCFDEMNLARVEYYFAPFLSAMETGGPIAIHSHEGTIDAVEPSVPWPKNLFIIGTVNMDETTLAFSDKVLDRAYTLEFWEVDLDEFQKKYAAGHADYPAELLDVAMQLLRDILAVLAPINQHFGYRTAEDVLNFVAACQRETGETLSRAHVLDQALMMKVLPKVRGQDSTAFRTCLSNLHELLTLRGFSQCTSKVATLRNDLELTGTCRFWR